MQQQLLSRTNTANASAFAPKQARRTTSITASKLASRSSLPHNRCYQHGSQKLLREQSTAATRASQCTPSVRASAVSAGMITQPLVRVLDAEIPLTDIDGIVPAATASTSGRTHECHSHEDDRLQKAVNSGMGFIVGDILAQRLTGEAFDAVRSLELGLYGTLLDGPIKHLFNKTVDKAVGSGARAKLARAAADNYIWMPVATCLLFSALKLAQGQPEEIVSSCQDKLLSMAVANHVLWPLAKFVNAKIVPKKHQPVANKVVQVVWSAWLSTLGHAPSVVDLAQSAPVEHFTDAASSLVDQFIPEHIHTSVANAIHSSVEHFVSPFLEQAADVMESASDVMERLPSTFLDKAFSKSLDVVTPFERMARSPSQLMEVGAVGAAAYPMARAASHMLERHGPGLQRAASHMLERSKQDMNRASSSMAQVLERAASRALVASQHFERAASTRLDSLDRAEGRQRNSLDLAITQVLQGMGHLSPSTPEQPANRSPAAKSPSKSRFAVEAVAVPC